MLTEQQQKEISMLIEAIKNDGNYQPYKDNYTNDLYAKHGIQRSIDKADIDSIQSLAHFAETDLELFESCLTMLSDEEMRTFVKSEFARLEIIKNNLIKSLIPMFTTTATAALIIATMVDDKEKKIAALIADFKAIYNICQSAAVNVEMGTDAHANTQTIIRNDYPNITTIHDNNLITAQQDINIVIREIQQTAVDLELETSYQNGVKKTLGDIKNFIDIEPETNIYVHDILKRTWSLTKDESDKGLVLDCINDNVVGKGGCIAGIIARLYPVYARFLRVELENLLQNIGVSVDDIIESMATITITESAQASEVVAAPPKHDPWKLGNKLR